MAKKVKLSATQRKILENAAGREPPHRPFGRSQSGGWDRSQLSCRANGWVRRGENGDVLTEAGRAALRGHALPPTAHDASEIDGKAETRDGDQIVEGHFGAFQTDKSEIGIIEKRLPPPIRMDLSAHKPAGHARKGGA